MRDIATIEIGRRRGDANRWVGWIAIATRCRRCGWSGSSPDHIPVVGVDALINVVVEGGVAKVDAAALAEIAAEEVVELVEQFLAEGGVERPAGGVDVIHEPGKDALGIVPGLDLHQIDVAGFPFDFGSYEDVAQGIEKLLFVAVEFGHGGIIGERRKQG